jgi:hypothetical protein
MADGHCPQDALHMWTLPKSYAPNKEPRGWYRANAQELARQLVRRLFSRNFETRNALLVGITFVKSASVYE